MNHRSLTSHFKSSPVLALMLLALISTVQAETTELYTTSQIWGYGVAASVGVSLLGFVMALILILILRIKKLGPAGLKLIISVLISFAIGALLSDVIVHMMPEIFGSHDHEAESGSTETPAARLLAETATEEKAKPAISSLIILVGFGTFVLLDKLFEVLGIAHSHGVDEDDHHHGHHHEHKKHAHHHEKTASSERTLKKEGSTQDEMKEAVKQEQNGDEVEKINVDSDASPTNMVKVKEAPKLNVNENKSSSCLKTFCSFKGRKSGGIMILLADFIHNILDGLAIGVAFASGKRDLAVSTFVAVFAHEVPQEIGDMGILVESKFPIGQALMCNGIINFSALIGTFIGLGTGSLNEVANAYVLSFVAGNFLYISLVSMLPSVMKQSQGRKAIFNLIAFIIGCGVMFAVLAAESD